MGYRDRRAIKRKVKGPRIGINVGAYPESPSYHKRTPVEAAPTTNATCSFQITA
jgi:hypothetical protein